MAIRLLFEGSLLFTLGDWGELGPGARDKALSLIVKLIHNHDVKATQQKIGTDRMHHHSI